MTSFFSATLNWIEKNLFILKFWNLNHIVFFRLATTLRYLATEDSYPTLSYGFRVGISTICEIIQETCCIIWNKLQLLVLNVLTEDKWTRISNDFLNLWSIPNCLGAIDGKHVIIQAPSKTTSWPCITQFIVWPEIIRWWPKYTTTSRATILSNKYKNSSFLCWWWGLSSEGNSDASIQQTQSRFINSWWKNIQL